MSIKLTFNILKKCIIDGGVYNDLSYKERVRDLLKLFGVQQLSQLPVSEYEKFYIELIKITKND